MINPANSRHSIYMMYCYKNYVPENFFSFPSKIVQFTFQTIKPT